MFKLDFLLLETKVQELDLSSKELSSVQPDIKNLTNLVLLDLSRNPIHCQTSKDYQGLPVELSRLPALRCLFMSECGLNVVPPVVWKCKGLEVLDISMNKIEEIPPKLGDLTKLEHLNVQQTNIKTLPQEIACCQDLKELLMWGNPIQSLPVSMQYLTLLDRLAINYQQFGAGIDKYMQGLLANGQIQSDHLPQVIFELESLDLLDLEYTKINNLPDRCRANLSECYLGQNFLREVPQILLEMDRLVVLDISKNQVNEIPSEIENLKMLKTIRLNRNQIAEIPESLCTLSGLQELDLGFNKLQHLPRNIGCLTNLRKLLLRKNHLTEVPEELESLQQLETLDLSNNSIRSLPASLHKLSSMKAAHGYKNLNRYGLWLCDNPLTSPPPETWKTEDVERIFTYLKRSQMGNKTSRMRKKIIVLGNGRTCKSHLINSIIPGKTYTLCASKVGSKPVVNITRWKTANGVDFVVHEMCGSAIWRMACPMFLDEKAIYLIVFNHKGFAEERFQSEIGDWIDMILVHAPDARITVVGTNSDLNDEVVNDAEVLSRLVSNYVRKKNNLQQAQNSRTGSNSGGTTPAFVEPEIFLVDCGKGSASSLNLVSHIETLAVNVTASSQDIKIIPDEWKDICQILKKQQAGLYLDWEEVLRIANQAGISEDEIVPCLEYLHEVGELFWFSKIASMKKLVFARYTRFLGILSRLFTKGEGIMSQNRTNVESRLELNEIEAEVGGAYLTGRTTFKSLLNLFIDLKMNNFECLEFIDILERSNLCHTQYRKDRRSMNTTKVESVFFPVFCDRSG